MPASPLPVTAAIRDDLSFHSRAALISEFGRKVTCILAMQGVYNEALTFSLVRYHDQ